MAASRLCDDVVFLGKSYSLERMKPRAMPQPPSSSTNVRASCDSPGAKQFVGCGALRYEVEVSTVLKLRCADLLRSVAFTTALERLSLMGHKQTTHKVRPASEHVAPPRR